MSFLLPFAHPYQKELDVKTSKKLFQLFIHTQICILWTLLKNQYEPFSTRHSHFITKIITESCFVNHSVHFPLISHSFSEKLKGWCKRASRTPLGHQPFNETLLFAYILIRNQQKKRGLQETALLINWKINKYQNDKRFKYKLSFFNFTFSTQCYTLYCLHFYRKFQLKRQLETPKILCV